MLVKVAELIGLALDWAVAKCESLGVYVPAFAEKPWLQYRNYHGQPHMCPKYSTDWAQGGPLIDSAGIAVSFGPQWTAVHNRRLGHCYYGPTPLIAICRCYVASKLGDTVDIPDELFKGNKC